MGARLAVRGQSTSTHSLLLAYPLHGPGSDERSTAARRLLRSALCFADEAAVTSAPHIFVASQGWLCGVSEHTFRGAETKRRQLAACTSPPTAACPADELSSAQVGEADALSELDAAVAAILMRDAKVAAKEPQPRNKPPGANTSNAGGPDRVRLMTRNTRIRACSIHLRRPARSLLRVRSRPSEWKFGMCSTAA
jgi:hypothetical protein